MNRIKKIISLLLIISLLAAMTLTGGMLSASAAGTGIGLAEHALNAYYSGWSYVYGAASYGAVDCSGLIYLYSGTGSRSNMMGSSPETGSVANGIPNIHGLGLYEPGHVGVYVGGGMAVDARDEYYGVCYQSVYSKGWTNWFKVAGVSYPTNGWEYYNGSYYYYQNGEYLTNTYITVDGISYYLDASGVSSSTPGDTSAVVDTPSATTSSVMKVGSYGDNVTKLQQRLTELNFYNGEITGYFGEQTEAAYIRFQKAAGVYIDGIAGESDLEILYSDYAPTGSIAELGTSNTTAEVEEEPTEAETTTEAKASTSFSTGDYHDEVYNIQSQLGDLGYFNDDATGYYGELTEEAVKDFQSENGLTSTGVVDELTYKTLFSINALENPNQVESTDRTVVVNPNANEDNTEAPTEGTEATGTTETTESAIVSPTEATEIALKSAQLASKALEGVNVQAEADSSSKSNNGSFILWLVIMVVFMSTAFWIVFTTEKKKKKARFERIKARANRNW